MTLSAGTRLGPYEVGAEIGAGGMGNVYRALDTRLGRDVAIKTVKGPYSERFEHERRTISSLNHPHVCTLFVGARVSRDTRAATMRNRRCGSDLTGSARIQRRSPASVNRS